ncbi:MAG TPA: hypothetical protein VGV34_03730, partial [Solirubrobacterales bacterium]|nr:hypothetical protein [Solirubrobacterales bacterium]
CDGAFVHEDGSSALILDREPQEWSAGRQRGLGWVEGDARRPPATFHDWRGAADAGICGLVLEGRRRFLHSAVNGLAPLYWLEHEGAVYFASRIDPLVQTSPARLSIDWEAWAAILTIRIPPGDRTPFAEVKRLPQSATLRRRLGGARVKEERWPWAEIAPEQSREAAAEAAVAALEEALAPVPGGVVCPLSGGRDSRMLLALLARDGRAAAAVTTSDDEGDTREEDLAAPVAAALGVPHERLRGAERDYPGDWEERTRRSEYQLVDHAWLVPVAQRLAGAPGPVPDGFAMDVLLSGGPPFHSEATLDTSDPRAAALAMFEMLRHWGHAHVALEQGLQEPVISRAREQWLAAGRRFEGHPLQNILAFYAARSRRGVSTNPTQLLGDRSWVLTPGASDPFARAALSTPAASRLDGELYRAIFETLGPEVAALPFTAEVPRKPPHLPRRWCSPTALDFHRRSLLEGPLTPHLSPELRAWIEGPAEAEPNPHLRLGIESVSLLHAWWRRYRDRLREVDPTELRG